MDETIVKMIDHGVVDGFRTWEVVNAGTGENVGWNQTVDDTAQ